ncbi:MAG TPA: glutamate racemase [Elusimicrobiota bacterium]|nr:glutamate racemase [Elusimicrobiota bacterium]
MMNPIRKNPMTHRPIGVFDSGLGGLTVLRALRRLLSHENFIYVGDTARVPYGNKSAEAVTRFALEISHFLIHHEVKMIVVACNTVSALALDELKKKIDVPILGVIVPGAQAALNASPTGRIGVIGTSATIASRAYEKEIHRRDHSTSVFSRACPLFVPLVEEGWLDEEVTVQVARHYLRPLLSKRIDTLVLGCTHYPLLKTVLKRVSGRSVRLIDSAEETARDVRQHLEKKGALRSSGRGRCMFFSSDNPEQFAVQGRRFLNQPLGRVKRIHLVGIHTSAYIP